MRYNNERKIQVFRPRAYNGGLEVEQWRRQDFVTGGEVNCYTLVTYLVTYKQRKIQYTRNVGVTFHGS